MLTGNKRNDYLELVAKAKEVYETQDGTNTMLIWHPECKEINFWTYWQGTDYAEKTPEIDILLVGQDWGNPFGDNVPMTVSNIQKINREKQLGKISTQYLDGVDMTRRDSQTDNNLITLFKEIGYPDIDQKRYENLFFTNFSLGYRRKGSNTGKMTITQLKRDQDLFRDLCDILQPKKIICLGKITYKAVLVALGEKYKDSETYNTILDNKQNKKEIDRKSYKTMVYGMAHCGYFGTRNRKDVPGTKNRKADLTKQINDWKCIISE